MARQALPIVGAVVGAFFGMPQLGYAIGAIVGNAVDPQVIKGPRLGEGLENSASEGGYRPIVLGKGAVGVCMIHQGPLKKRTIRHRQSKGGGPVVEEERAYRTMAFALGESAYPDNGVVLLRLWIDNKLRYDVTPTSQIVAESADFAQQFTFYPGDNQQLPDPDIEAFMGAGNVPSYRGGAPYIVLPNYDVTDSRGMAPIIKAELASVAIVGGNTIAVGRMFEPTEDAASSYSLDGEDWSEPVRKVPLDNYISPLGNAFVTWDLQSTHVTYDLGETWEGPFGNFPIIGIGRQSYTRTEVLLIPGGDERVYRTINGKSFQTITLPGPYAAHSCSVNRTSAVVFGHGAGQPLISSDSAHMGWTVGGLCPVYSFTDRWMECSETRHMIGGPSSNIDSRPMISSSTDGKVWDINYVFSSSEGGTISRLCAGSGADWVAVTDNGEVWYTENNGISWTKVSQEFGNITGLCFNGDVFIISEGVYSDGRILTSVNKSVWVERTQPLDDIQLLSSTPLTPSPLAQRIPLSQIVGWCHDRVDLSPAKYNANELSDLVEGVVFADGYTAADAIRTAAGWYFFDAGEYDAGSGYRINYVKRGAAAVATLTEQDIVDGPEDWEREDSYERPRVLHIAYPNPVVDYGAPTVPIKRTSPDVLVVGERSINVPFVTSDQDEVARRGDMAMTVIYAEIAGTYEIVLPLSWLSLAPTDCIGFSIRERVRRLRLTDWKFTPDGTIRTEWMSDRQSAYTSNLTALPPTPTTPPPPSIVGPTISAVLDIPALADGMDTLHLITAATGQSEAWWGSQHQVKLPSDSTFSTVASFSPPTTIMGVLESTVTDASQHYTDTTNVIRVVLYRDDELETFTQQQFLSEHGAFALSWMDGEERRWEILQYRDAVKVGERTWELSTLTRGRLDTEPAEHTPGSMFVLLDIGVRAIPAQTSWLGQDITHRGVSNGQLPEQAVAYSEEYTGQSQREWPVAHLFGEVEGGTLHLSCVPRHRFGTDNHPVQSVNHAGYRWTATDGTDSVAADTMDPHVAIDIDGWSLPIAVTVAQLNRFTGAGPSVLEVIE